MTQCALSRKLTAFTLFQVVPHVHFHVIPKTSEEDGLQIGWPTQKADMDELKKYHEEL